jgi:phage tail sheath gpL-like
MPYPLYKGYAYVISGTITSATGVEDCCVGGRFQYVPVFKTNATITDPTAIANELASHPDVPIVNPGGLGSVFTITFLGFSGAWRSTGATGRVV